MDKTYFLKIVENLEKIGQKKGNPPDANSPCYNIYVDKISVFSFFQMQKP